MGPADDGDANVITLFLRAAARRGGAPAILAPAGDVLWTFDGLADAAGRLAGALASVGIGPGHRVLVLEPDRRRRHAAVGAVLWAGGAVVIPPASLPPMRAITVAAAANPDAVLLAPWLWPLAVAHPALRTVPIRLLTAGPRIPGALRLADLPSVPVFPARVDADDQAVLSFTTGSSGAPKLVRRSHRVLGAQHDALERLRGLTSDDRELVGLPLLVLHNLASGVASVLAPADRRFGGDAGSAVVESVERSRATAAVGFPALFEPAARPGVTGSMPTLRSIRVGGTRVRAELVAALARLAPAARLDVVYGSTEVEPIAAIAGAAYLAALAHDDPALGVPAGRLVDGLELRLVPPSGDAPRREGRPAGVVSLRGAHVAADDGTGGWVNTGDLGWVDRDGLLRLLGRATDAVGALTPFEVELATERLDHVRRAALVRAPGPLGPRAVVAVELDRGGRDAAAAVTSAVRELAGRRGWQVDDVVVRRRLPETRGPARKVDTAALARAPIATSGTCARAGAADDSDAREASTRGPHPGRRGRAQPLANPSRPSRRSLPCRASLPCTRSRSRKSS